MKGVRYISLHEHSGYADAARRVMLGLIGQGVPLTWTPMVPGMSWRLGYEPFRGRSPSDAGELTPHCNAKIDYDTVIIHTVPEYYPLWCDELRAGRGTRPLILGSAVWETTHLPAHWPDLLRSVDGLLVPCRWNRELFSRAGLGIPVELLPHPCPDLPIDLPGRPEPADKPFTFYSINAWSPRKAMESTLEAFLRAFDRGDDVEFILKTSPEDFGRPRGGFFGKLLGRYPSSQPAAAAVIGRYPNAAPVEIITETLSDATLLRLHERGDAYISLTHSEGWGIGAFDAAALGIPVIMTGFGGQLEYLGEEYPGLVGFEPVQVVEKKGWESYTRDQSWAEPRVEHAVELMREIVANPGGWRRRSDELGREIRTRFSRGRVAADLVETIARIASKRSGD